MRVLALLYRVDAWFGLFDEEGELWHAYDGGFALVNANFSRWVCFFGCWAALVECVEGYCETELCLWCLWRLWRRRRLVYVAHAFVFDVESVPPYGFSALCKVW